MFHLFIFLCMVNAETSPFPEQVTCSERKMTALQEDTLVAGNWSGTSTCQSANSGCHDELAFYHISKTTNPKVYRIAGYKIVNRDTLNMGTLDFNYESSSKTLTCNNSNGAWTLVITGNAMKGELRRSGNSVFRKILLKKV